MLTDKQKQRLLEKFNVFKEWCYKNNVKEFTLKWQKNWNKCLYGVKPKIDKLIDRHRYLKHRIQIATELKELKSSVKKILYIEKKIYQCSMEWYRYANNAQWCAPMLTTEDLDKLNLSRKITLDKTSLSGRAKLAIIHYYQGNFGEYPRLSEIKIFDLRDIPKRELFYLKGVGKKTISEIESLCKKYNFKLK